VPAAKADRRRPPPPGKPVHVARRLARLTGRKRSLLASPRRARLGRHGHGRHRQISAADSRPGRRFSRSRMALTVSRRMVPDSRGGDARRAGVPPGRPGLGEGGKKKKSRHVGIPMVALHINPKPVRRRRYRLYRGRRL